MAKPSLVDKIKSKIEKAAQNKKKMEHLDKTFRIRAKDGAKRIRFLTDFEDVVEVMMHEKYGTIFPTPCGQYFDEECKWCDLDGVSTNEYYAWTVWDRNKKQGEKKVVFCFKATGMSPVPLMVKRYQKYGTLLDRMYEISVSGERWSKTWDLVPEGDKRDSWKNNPKPYTKKEVFDILLKAGGSSDNGGNDDGNGDEDDKPVKKKKRRDDDE